MILGNAIVLLHLHFKFHLVSFLCLQVTKPLLETSRKGYLAALSASTYSYISLLKHFAPLINSGKD